MRDWIKFNLIHTRAMQIDQDNKFTVSIVDEATSPNIPLAIWKAQHICVDNKPLDDSFSLLGEKAEQAIIKYELGESGKRGHYSVLRFAFISMECHGFPHDTVMQLRTHYSSGINMLVTSMRYTDFSGMSPEDLFYFRQPGLYCDREGKGYGYSESQRNADFNFANLSLIRYKNMIESGCPKEQARGILPFATRQPFAICGDLRSWFHMLDNRTKKNAQLECQIFCQMAISELSNRIPTLMEWYRKNRMEKAILAP
jgi:thymidylate synthase (FAD)